MSVSQYKRYIWLVDTIRSAGKISREEIDRKWASARINDNHESRLADSTFFRYKNDVEELFDIEILCDRANGLYYIDDSDINSQTKQWLLSQFAVSQSLDTSRELRDRILYEPIPEGTEYLTTIVNAMRDSKWLHVSHLRFDSKESPHIFLLAPLCLKVFKQRWYVLGFIEEIDGVHNTPKNEPRLYALDRVKHMETMERPSDYQRTSTRSPILTAIMVSSAASSSRRNLSVRVFRKMQLLLSVLFHFITRRKRLSLASLSGS